MLNSIMRETVNINGVFYDAKTGLPIEPEKPKLDTPTKPIKSSKKISVRAPRKINISANTNNKPKPPVKAAHKPSSSRTLNRRYVSKPISKTAKPIQKAAPKPEAAPSQNTRPTISTRPSPVVPRGNRRPVSKTPKLNQISKPTKVDNASNDDKKINKTPPIIISILIILSIAVCVLSYFFIPSVSFWISSMRADVKSSLPTYTVSGYSIDGHVHASPGIVTIDYKSSTNNMYTIEMANSNWDSDGVLENKIKPNASKYQTLEQKGLTIFVQDDSAMWVNGGVLYTIWFDSHMSNDEILKIIDGI